MIGTKADPGKGTRKDVTSLQAASHGTSRKERFWLKGEPVELSVYRIPTKLLYFNIENGRYADKMIQLRADNPGAEIDPKQDDWKHQIFRMLKGDYKGTAPDHEPFDNLRADILAKTQLRPGVVLHDGGVLDGNRRLAVLLDLEKTERNPARFQFFESVILDEDVGAEDRWRIEAGLQIGREERLAYSPINQLLKIREGLRLFSHKKNPEKEIAKTLYGIPENEIKKDIRKIELIDQYLGFIGKPQMYNEVGRVLERFEEAVKALDAAQKLGWSPHETQKLKTTLFALIRDDVISNWDMRYVWQAMGATRKGTLRNDTALQTLLEIGSDVPKLMKTLRQKGEHSPQHKYHEQKSQEFVDRMEVLKLANHPLTLAERAKSALEQLKKALGPDQQAHKDLDKHLEALPQLLKDIRGLVIECNDLVNDLKHSGKKAG